MRITFILPSIGRKINYAYPNSWLMEPLCISMLSAFTPYGIEKKFYDDRIEKIPFDAPTDLVAINAETYTAKRAYQIADHYRRKNVPVIFGGFHATLMSEEVLQNADSVMIGEAEGTWNEVLKDFSSNKLKPRYESKERPQLKGLRPDRLIYKDKKYQKISLVETGRGCFFDCEFCSIAGFYKSTYSARPVEEVIEEIKSLDNKNIFFVDDNLCVDLNRAKQFFEALIPLKIRWMGQVSINISNNSELLNIMHKSGCIGVLIGFETLEPMHLAKMNKTMNPETLIDYENAINNFYKFNIAIYATFVFGYDSDTEDLFKKTLDFAIKNKFFFTAFNHLVPFPGTRLYERLKLENRLMNDPWWLNDQYKFGDVAFKPKQMSAEKLALLCFEYRKKFYSLSSLFKRISKSNCNSLFKSFLYFAQNIYAKKDVSLRQGLTLGMKN
ncbi:MAG: hypothetical protein ACD_79C01221G0007 [uncultured bacterium]|nr:MAG: hypothetical protein ACD_79C01221G0007 [uncultured bacterium]